MIKIESLMLIASIFLIPGYAYPDKSILYPSTGVPHGNPELLKKLSSGSKGICSAAKNSAVLVLELDTKRFAEIKSFEVIIENILYEVSFDVKRNQHFYMWIYRNKRKTHRVKNFWEQQSIQDQGSKRKYAFILQKYINREFRDYISDHATVNIFNTDGKMHSQIIDLSYDIPEQCGIMPTLFRVVKY